MTDICLFAHYDRNDRLADHVLYYLKALRQAGFDVLVISTAKLNGQDRGRLVSINVDLVLRENAGLDFGSWALGLAHLRDASGRLNIDGRLLLANDSVFGPIGDLAEAIRRLLTLPADVHCMVETIEKVPHMQSWFLIFSPAAYRSSAFQTIFAQNFAAMTKDDVIARGEIALTLGLHSAGFQFAALASNPPQGGVRRLMRANPAHFLWQSLLELDGVPFIKVELLRDNPVEVTVDGWREAVRVRAPELLPSIDKYLGAISRRRALPRRRWSALSVETFVLRDDRLARAGAGLVARLNFLAWRVLLAALIARRCFLAKVAKRACSPQRISERGSDQIAGQEIMTPTEGSSIRNRDFPDTPEGS
jgi:Rhamnan synthesis protein F